MNCAFFGSQPWFPCPLSAVVMPHIKGANSRILILNEEDFTDLYALIKNGEITLPYILTVIALIRYNRLHTRQFGNQLWCCRTMTDFPRISNSIDKPPLSTAR